MAKDSISSEFIEEVLLFELESLIKLIEYMEDQIKEIEIIIISIWERVTNKHFIQTIHGITDLMAATVWA